MIWRDSFPGEAQGEEHLGASATLAFHDERRAQRLRGTVQKAPLSTVALMVTRPAAH
ncbi:MAG TPA: hypothetical protein VGM54_04380 [Chthoniobacter sp.]|jgi:hypothetical protein